MSGLLPEAVRIPFFPVKPTCHEYVVSFSWESWLGCIVGDDSAVSVRRICMRLLIQSDLDATSQESTTCLRTYNILNSHKGDMEKGRRVMDMRHDQHTPFR